MPTRSRSRTLEWYSTWVRESVIRCYLSQPLAEVAIAGPTAGAAGLSYTLQAQVAPLGATRPITYTWEPEPVLGQGTPDTTYSWSLASTYPLTVTAEHCGGIVTGTLTINIEPLPRVYLPLVLRGH